MHTVIGPERLARAKRAFSTRRAPDQALRAISDSIAAPAPGDLVLARVDSIGQHDRLELTNSRKAHLFPGDEIIVAYGARYAPDQFEAHVPASLGPCSLVAGGGIAGVELQRHAKMREPTAITPLGVFTDESGRALNLRRFGLQAGPIARRVPTIAVVGGSMNAGKTTAAAMTVRGLARAGYKVGAAKLTGTGAGNDFWHMSDAGAHTVLDFTDAGLATTYQASGADIVRSAETLASALVEAGCEVLVFEIADGVFQEETAWLVSSPALEHLVDAYLYAAESAASAVLGGRWLAQHRRELLAVSGLFTTSPLAMREAQRALNLPCLNRDALAAPETGRAWMQRLQAPASAAA